jgi:membrane protein implicated in regulation of membrane protease activity
METYLIWLVAGFLLIIVELVTGTFYLLVLGAAALVGGGVAYAGQPFSVQAVIAAALAVSGVMWVNRMRRASTGSRMRSLDVGQSTTFDHWVDHAAGKARVKYRDALWDATVTDVVQAQGQDELRGETGETLYIESIDGNTLKVSKIRPA